MPPKEPSPQTTLLILLGADNWPSATYGSSIAFKNAARDLHAYFISDPNGFHLPTSNVLDLFNSNDSVSDMLDRIRYFLTSHISRKKGSSAEIKDIFVYYVGHGGITSTSSIFYLTIRRTFKDFEKSTSIAMDDLAELLKKSARFQRCILILDCCFAAAAVKFHQGSSTTVILREKTIAAFKEKDQGVGSLPSRGTSFLCSSGQDVASVILPDKTSTMFTYALLSALRTGDPFQKRERLSLDTVHRLTTDFLSKTYSGNFPQPELHSPAQPEGKVEDVPFFPNAAFIAEKERLRQATQQQYSTSNYPPQSHQQQYSTSNYSLRSYPQGFPTNPIFASGPQKTHIGSSIASVLGWSALVLSVLSMIFVTLFYAHIVFTTQSTIYTASPDETYVIYAIIADICIFLGIILGLQGLKKNQARPARLLRVVAIFAIAVPLVLDMGIGIILLSELVPYSLTQQLSPELVSTLQPLSNIGSYLNAGGFILLGLSLLVEKIYPRAGTVVIICGIVSILLSIFGFSIFRFVGLSFIVALNPLPSFLLVAPNNVVLTIQCIVCLCILTKAGWYQFIKFIRL